MSNPVVLTPSAANKIRAAVTAISMPSRPYGVLGAGARGGRQPMPLDITIEQVSGVEHAFIRLKDLRVAGNGRNSDGHIAVDSHNCPSLYTAINNGDEKWDAGSLGTSPWILYFYFYVVTLYYNAYTPPDETMRWGIAVGASDAAALAAIPQPIANPSRDWDPCSIVAIMPIGWASMQGNVPTIGQSWRGSVLMPLLCPVDVVTDVQYDINNKQIQKRVQRIYAPMISSWIAAARFDSLDPGAYADWRKITGGQAEVYP